MAQDRSSFNYDEFEGKDIRARVILSFLVFAQKHYPNIDVYKICEEARVDPERIFKKDDWLTARETFDILDRLKEASGDPTLSYRAGEFGISEQYLGKSVVLTLKYLFSVTAIYKSLASMIKQFNRTLELEVLKPSYWKSEIEIIVRLKKEALTSGNRALLVEHFYDVVINILGYLKAIPTLKGLPKAQVNIVKKPVGLGENPEYTLQVKYLDFSLFSNGFLVLAALVGVVAMVIQGELWVDYLKGLEMESVFKALSVVFLMSSLVLGMMLKRARNLIAGGGMSEELGDDRSESFGNALELFTRAIPKDLLKLAGVTNLRQLSSGHHGVERDLTVLVLDLKKFSTIAEILGPKETFRWVNRFYSLANQVIKKHHGIIDKFIGDSLLCYFTNGPEEALRALMELEQKVKELSEGLDPQVAYQFRGGLHHGPTMIGILGDESYFEVTGIGDTVNTATRLEGLNKRLETQVLISERTRAELSSEFLEQMQSRIKARGVYELRGIKKELNVFEFILSEESSQKKVA